MFDGLKVIRTKGFTNLTGVHPFLSKIALDVGTVQQVMKAYNFPDREIQYRKVNIGYAVVEIPYEKDIYGTKVKIEKLSDILYISDIADMYDSPDNVIKRRIYHSNIQPIYHGFLNGSGTVNSFFNLADQTLEAYMVMIAYTDHYYQDAFAPMHITLKDQDVHIPFEHAFDKYLWTHASELEDKVIKLVQNRGVIDISEYGSTQKFAMNFVKHYMPVRDKMVQDYRNGNYTFEGIDIFMYGAVLATLGNASNYIVKDYLWRRLQ